MAFHLTGVKLTYTSIKFFKPAVHKLVLVVLAVSRFCLKFYKDCYNPKNCCDFTFPNALVLPHDNRFN